MLSEFVAHTDTISGGNLLKSEGVERSDHLFEGS